MSRTLVDEYMNEIIPYGGLPTRRADVIRHLQSVGCEPTDVAFASYMEKPVLQEWESEPLQEWDAEAEELVRYPHSDGGRE